MNTKLQSIGADEVEEGDTVMIDGQAKLIEDIRENGRMDGVWLQFSDGHDRFFDYNDTVQLVTK